MRKQEMIMNVLLKMILMLFQAMVQFSIMTLEFSILLMIEIEILIKVLIKMILKILPTTNEFSILNSDFSKN